MAGAVGGGQSTILGSPPTIQIPSSMSHAPTSTTNPPTTHTHHIIPLNPNYHHSSTFQLSPTKHPAQQGYKLFVGNLSFRTQSAALRDAFEPFGRIVFSTVIENRETGQSR